MKQALFLSVLALAVLVSGLGCTAADTGLVEVVKVIDGDTVVISGGMHLRYIGMDAPEVGQPFGDEATEANRRLVQGKRVRLEKDISDKDRYGRLLRYVYLDATLVNLELVREGWAQAKAYPPDTRYQDKLIDAEGEAKTAGRGMWVGTR